MFTQFIDFFLCLLSGKDVNLQENTKIPEKKVFSFGHQIYIKKRLFLVFMLYHYQIYQKTDM